MREPDDDVLGRAYDARLMRRIWGVARPHSGLLLLSLLVFPLAAGLELLQPYLTKVAVDDYILVGDWGGLGRVALAYLALLVALYGVRVAQAWLLQVAGQRVMHDLRNALFAHLQRMDAAFFDKNPVGRLMTRVLYDVEAINELFASGVVSILGDVLLLVGVVIVLLGMNWRLALVTFAVVPLLVAVAVFFRLRAREAYRRVRTQLSRLNAFLQESISGMSVIQLFVREEPERARFAAQNGELRQAQFRSTFYDVLLYSSVEAIGSAAVALLVWYGGGEVIQGTLTFGALVAFIEYTNRFFLPIRDLGAKYTVMQAAMVSAERVFGLLDTAPSVTGPAPGAPAAARPRGPAPSAPSGPAVEFRNVWFAYDGESWVLRDCSFHVVPGEQVALVGPTGQGKTTVARLMTRAYDVARGQVLVNGRDVREWDLRALRRHVGVIPQEVFLFAGSVRENLALGRDGVVAAAEVERAVQAASAVRLIDSLPGGLDAVVRERGANLSQGQRQLLAIARALLYNPPVLALDEATSSVDPDSEIAIRDGLARLLAGRTSVIIAHRLSTIKLADRILVLHHGAVQESGRHAELLARGGYYARLHELAFGLAGA